MKKQDVYLIDSSIYIFKSYYSMPDEFHSTQGQSINAVYGFARFLTQFIHQTGANYIACAFDESLSTSFRNEIYPPYKANRDPAPEDLKQQFALCRQVAEAMGIACYSDESYEADDLLGTLAKTYRDRGFKINVVSADKDLAQVLGEEDTWWNYGKTEAFDSEQVFEKFGVYPNQIADYLALTGDAVDNIPGVSGVGPKTASILLEHFKTLEQILNRHQEIAYLSFRGAKSCQKKIASQIEQAQLAQQLTIIVEDIPMGDVDIKRTAIDETSINQLFDYLNFGPMLRRRILEIKNIN